MKRYDLKMSDDMHERVKHFAKVYGAKGDKTTLNEFILTALDYYMKYCVGDYNVNEMSIARLNQLVDVVAEMNNSMTALTTNVVNGFAVMYNLTSGDNYLNDDLLKGDDNEYQGS